MGLTVAVVGATGAAGRAIVRRLESSALAVGALRLFASGRRPGRTIAFGGRDLGVEPVAAGGFAGADLVFFAAGAAVSRGFVPAATAAGAVVIDCSSAFRLDPAVPLVVPEVNARALAAGPRVIASPNCSATILALPLEAVRRLSPLRRVLVATYQAASGAGAAGVRELEAGARAVLAGGEPRCRAFPRPLAFNVVPQVGAFEAAGFTGEESKIAREIRKILGAEDLKIAATCVRVPVFRAHSEAVYVETREVLDPATVQRAFAAFPGLALRDDPARGEYPTPRAAEGRDAVLVGRVRGDPDVRRGLHFWVVGDQLLKGAALNALQIAEVVLGGDAGRA